MLKNIDPLLSPDLLRILCEMGHGNTIVIADANFTAMQLASANRPVPCPVIRMPGISIVRAAQAVLSVLPLGTVGELPVQCMQVGNGGVAALCQLHICQRRDRTSLACLRLCCTPHLRL